MNWGSAGEFFAMGGHGFFVWACYGVTAIVMLAEPLTAARRHAQSRQQAQRQQQTLEADPT